jgi:hypothetical protein
MPCLILATTAPLPEEPHVLELPGVDAPLPARPLRAWVANDCHMASVELPELEGQERLSFVHGVTWSAQASRGLIRCHEPESEPENINAVACIAALPDFTDDCGGHARLMLRRCLLEN